MGNAIGEENIRLAKLLNKLGLVMAGSITVILALLSHRYSQSIARFYTQDLDVVPILSNVIQSLFVPIIFFAFTLIPQGALKALKK